jgi:hypothetical protein
MNFDTVHNYYERLVFTEIQDNYVSSALNEEALGDLACLSLNSLPSRYIRYDIDMSFYMSGTEYLNNHAKVKKAVADAYQKIAEQQKADEEDKDEDADA